MLDGNKHKQESSEISLCQKLPLQIEHNEPGEEDE